MTWDAYELFKVGESGRIKSTLMKSPTHLIQIQILPAMPLPLLFLLVLIRMLARRSSSISSI